MDIRRLQALGEETGKVDAAAAEMPGHDVMVAEPVVLSPGIKQQVRIPRSQLTITALKEDSSSSRRTIRETLPSSSPVTVTRSLCTHQRRASSSSVRVTRELLGANGEDGRPRAKIVGPPLHNPVKIPGTDMRIARQIYPVEPDAGGGRRPRRRHERHHQNRNDTLTSIG
jgi:hypothetical protein